MNDTMRREKGLAEIQAFLNNQKRSAVQKAMEESLISAFQNNAPTPLIEVMQKSAGITDIRLDELKKQAQAK